MEAALAARSLGYAVRVFERGRIGESLRRFGQVRLFSPFRANASPLGIAALAATGRWRQPADDALLTAAEFVEGYLRPLADLGLLQGTIHENTSVVAVGRDGLLKGEHVGDDLRAARPFRLLLKNAEGDEWSELADVVIDATGTFGNANCLGSGGVPAVGEMRAASRIEHGLPDVTGRDRDRFAGKTTLVVGAGYSAATNVIALAELAGQAVGTRVVWLTRRVRAAGFTSRISLAPQGGQPPEPMARIENDRLGERDRVAARANQLAREAQVVQHFAAWQVTHIRLEGEQVHVTARHFAPEGDAAEGLTREFVVDRILANCGFRPDNSIYQELQVHECYASGGPMKLAAALAGRASGDCLDQAGHGPESLRLQEPNFFILGAKSYGRNSSFLLSVGLEQVRDAFRLITSDVTPDVETKARAAEHRSW